MRTDRAFDDERARCVSSEASAVAHETPIRWWQLDGTSAQIVVGIRSTKDGELDVRRCFTYRVMKSSFHARERNTSMPTRRHYAIHRGGSVADSDASLRDRMAAERCLHWDVYRGSTKARASTAGGAPHAQRVLRHLPVSPGRDRLLVRGGGGGGDRPRQHSFGSEMLGAVRAWT